MLVIFVVVVQKAKLKRHFRLLHKTVKSILKKKRKFVKERSLEQLHDEFCGFTLQHLHLQQSK